MSLSEIIDAEVEEKAKYLSKKLVKNNILEIADARIEIYTKTLKKLKKDINRIEKLYEEEEKKHRKYREKRMEELYNELNEIEEYIEGKEIDGDKALDIAILASSASCSKKIDILKKYLFIESYCHSISYVKKCANALIEKLLNKFDKETRKEIIEKCVKRYEILIELDELYSDEISNPSNYYSDLLQDLYEKLYDLTDLIALLKEIKKTSEEILNSEDDCLELKKELIYLLNSDKQILNMFT